MAKPVEYSKKERLWLIAIGVFGFVGINGAFLYAVLFKPNTLVAALSNPVVAAFMIETLVLLGLLAYLFERWRISRLGWRWFVLLALAGSMAFAIPVVLLFPRDRRPPS